MARLVPLRDMTVAQLMDAAYKVVSDFKPSEDNGQGMPTAYGYANIDLALPIVACAFEQAKKILK